MCWVLDWFIKGTQVRVVCFWKRGFSLSTWKLFWRRNKCLTKQSLSFVFTIEKFRLQLFPSPSPSPLFTSSTPRPIIYCLHFRADDMHQTRFSVSRRHPFFPFRPLYPFFFSRNFSLFYFTYTSFPFSIVHGPSFQRPFIFSLSLSLFGHIEPESPKLL